MSGGVNVICCNIMCYVCIVTQVKIHRFSVEIFINDGEQVMSAVLFTEQEAKGISFSVSKMSLGSSNSAY